MKKSILRVHCTWYIFMQNWERRKFVNCCGNGNGNGQMGSTMKKSIFDDQTSKALKKWHKNALKKVASKGRNTETRTLGGSPGGSPDHSPRHTATTSHQTATIMTTVDHDRYDNHDLLTGPWHTRTQQHTWLEVIAASCTRNLNCITIVLYCSVPFWLIYLVRAPVNNSLLMHHVFLQLRSTRISKLAKGHGFINCSTA